MQQTEHPLPLLHDGCRYCFPTPQVRGNFERYSKTAGVHPRPHGGVAFTGTPNEASAFMRIVLMMITIPMATLTLTIINVGNIPLLMAGLNTAQHNTQRAKCGQAILTQ